ncbi:hypothetical protein PN441_15445 [Spirulina major CS-329]|uniref:hypothetical protein n=1 Tax=Spirulina TaxID=1154 RepID=UPI00232B713E|nr:MULTISPECIES: hypothetical protein [Spirulina]MDB9496037.1 hypothetical protein [Spirulina subsalsa CS-330]MDB9504470.1 hypothetical protein [Spirulina major CS-329]
MFGHYQKSCLRIELDASQAAIAASLQNPDQFRRWLFPQRLETDIPNPLKAGATFTAWTGPIAIDHYVDLATPQSLRLILSRGIDGFHEWYWGDGWVQSRLEGVSLLPIALGQTATLIRLRYFLTRSAAGDSHSRGKPSP